MNIKNFNVVEGTTHYINIDCVHDDSNEKFYLEGYEVIFWLRTKNNDVIAFVVGSDEYGDVSLTIFPNVYSRFNNIKINDIIEISGRVERRFDKYQIVVNSIKILE